MSVQPTKIGKYEVIREIARSNDIVYEAFDQSMGRRAAVKVLNFDPSESDEERGIRVERFKREVRVLAQIDHENVVRVWDSKDGPNEHFIAMEYVQGTRLNDLLETTGPMTLSKAAELVKQVLAGLEAIHLLGVVHRDLKPPNLMVINQTRLKIIDFGIASVPNSSKLTQTGLTIGTLSYMSPEQVRGEPIDSRSDLFSIGIILYELLTGMKPFEGTNVVATINAIANASPNFDSLPPKIVEFLKKSLNKRREDRFQTATEMKSALTALQTSSSVSNPTPGQPKAQVAQAVVPIRNQRQAANQIILNPPPQRVIPIPAKVIPNSGIPSQPNQSLSYDQNWNFWIWTFSIALFTAVAGAAFRGIFVVVAIALGIYFYSNIKSRALAIVPICALLGASLLMPLRDSIIPRPISAPAVSHDSPPVQGQEPRATPTNALSTKTASQGSVKPVASKQQVVHKTSDHKDSIKSVPSKPVHESPRFATSKPTAKQAPAKKPTESDSTEGLRGNSRLGQDSGNSDSGDDSAAGLRSGSRLGGN